MSEQIKATKKAQPFDIQKTIALFSLAGIVVSLILDSPYPLYAVLCLGGLPLLWLLLKELRHGNYGADILAGLSIITAVLLDEYLAGALVVLMLSGGEAIENYSVRKASRLLDALTGRAPTLAHRKTENGFEDIESSEVQIGDELSIYPHELCPVDGVVIDGHGEMDEAYLTGEPFWIAKAPGSTVLSGAINGDEAIVIRATAIAEDSRYAKIVEVIEQSEANKPHIRRLADTLGMWFTPLALMIAIIAWIFSGDPVRFLAVLVIATPCPLLIAIPVSIIAAISVCASKGIIIKNPAVLEQLTRCKTIIFDKTGTLTYGKPVLTEITCFDGFDEKTVLSLAASLEEYSKHPLATSIAVKAKASGLKVLPASSISEVKGQYLRGDVDGHDVIITNRSMMSEFDLGSLEDSLPEGTGLECVVIIDTQLAAHFRFHDEPRKDGRAFIAHLAPEHGMREVMILSGDREEEVMYIAQQLGIECVYASKTPEEKLEIVKEATSRGKTAYLGDGINDAPALIAATVGIAFGHHSDITSESADAVIMEDSLEVVDDFFHISDRMLRIALQSAVGGMILSFIGMMFAAFGYLSPVAGALTQEVIDIVAIMNALRVLMVRS